MTRVVLINLGLIFAPFIIYAAYIILDKQPATSEEFWALIPLKKILMIGVGLMLIFYITQLSLTPAQKGKYHPPEVRDGKIIPGYIEPEKEGDKKE